MKKSLLAALLLLPLSAPSWSVPDAFDGHGSATWPKIRPVAKPAAAESAATADNRLWVVVQAASSAERTKVSNAGVAIELVLPSQVAGVATPNSADRLAKLGIKFEATPLSSMLQSLDFPKKDAVFHNYDRMKTELNAIAGKAPALASVFSIGQSLEGRSLWAIRLNSSAQGDSSSSKPGIVFMGTHHAREHLSTEVPLLLAKYIVENKDKPEIAKMLDSRDVYVIPMVNPDGVEYDIRDGSYHMHRKNTRKNSDGSVGVDLNRNYGWQWGGEGSSSNPDDETYHGPSAFSEPETKTIKSFIERHDNLKILLTYHTFSELILYPWGCTDSPLDDKKSLSAYENMAQTMAQMTGYTPEQSSALYIASGDTTDWSWGTHKVFSFTFELTPKSQYAGGFYPGAKAIQPTFTANIRPALYLIDLADNPLRATAPQGETPKKRLFPFFPNPK